MNFDLAVVLPTRPEDGELLDQIDALVHSVAQEQRIIRWHPYEIHRPYLCTGNVPMACIGINRIWQERDLALEKPAIRLVKKRQKMMTIFREEEKAIHDDQTAAARCLVRLATWEAVHPFPMTPWRECWYQTLLDHASGVIAYLACERKTFYVKP